jgi:biopolymer transport protein ExbD
MRKPEPQKVEVDMVPMIDIIVLLLMFLVIVGDMAASANNVPMTLPRASEAKSDKELQEMHIRLEGRMCIQLKSDGGVWRAIVQNKAYDLVAGGAHAQLLRYLDEQVSYHVSKGLAKKDAGGAVDMPVKLRVPADAPMREVERVIMSCARVGLVNVHYAAEPTFKTR